MSQSAQPTFAAPAPLLGRIADVCRGRGLAGLADRLGALREWLGDELASVERELSSLPEGPRVVQASARHLLDLGGKHLRPMCVAIAAKIGTGFGEQARQLAVAVELVHSATLLHDDVIDGGDTRRGSPAARAIYGNAASIYAGDWLLVEALRRIRRAGIEGLVDDMLAVIEEMILAESIQLENRGRLGDGVSDYMRVVEGKTASLFRWAMRAGGRAGGLSEDHTDALERFGFHLGVAFQAVDDLLDLGGDASATGKDVLSDLREGKMTYPLVVAAARDSALAARLEAHLERPDGEDLAASEAAEISALVKASGGLEACRELAESRADEALKALSAIPDGAERRALAAVVHASIDRER